MISLDHKNNRGQAEFGRLWVANICCYFSYDTIVAVNIDGRLYYRSNEWGPTTGKHMNKMFNRGIGNEVDEQELDRIIREALVTYGLDYVKDRLDGKKTG